MVPEATRVAAVVRAACVLVLLPGLSACYYVHVARGQVDLSQRRVPIESVVADPAVPQSTRERLQYVQRVRGFAIDALGLPDNASYRSYADLGRPYVTWNVFAAPRHSVEPKQWCFPIAGCVTYRGYFTEQHANRHAASLAAQGYDVYVSGVPAYSTLGHFDDPVLNTMLRYRPVDVAALIFHELSHQVVYIAGDSAFNEAFATAVEYEGTRRWLAAEGTPAEAQQFRQRRERYFQVMELFVATRERLRRDYAAPGDAAALEARKAAAFARLVDDFAALKAGWQGDASYDWLVKPPLNNARLVAAATYHQCVPAFESLLAREGGDLPRFYAAVSAMRDSSKAERAAFCRSVPASAPGALPVAGVARLQPGGAQVARDDRLE